MRIALFFDGNNFYRSMDAFDPTIELDYDRLAAWTLQRVAPEHGELAGAYYYTGFSEQTGLDRFLKGLELRTGFCEDINDVGTRVYPVRQLADGRVCVGLAPAASV